MQDPRERAASAGIHAIAAKAALAAAEVHPRTALGIAFEQPVRTILDALPAPRAQHVEQFLGNGPRRARRYLATTPVSERIS